MPETTPPERTVADKAAIPEGAARGLRATAWGIMLSVALAIIKMLAGLIGNSYALIADGVESMLDVVSALVVWASLRVASRPPSERYPFGYGRIEPLAALVVAIALLSAALGIAVQSIREIRTPHHAPAPFTLVVLVLVIAVKELMYRRLLFAGREIGSGALQADAWHHRSDALTSLAAFIGISVSLWKGPGYEAADDWAALVACGVIAFNGVRLFRDAVAEIMDVAPPVELEQVVRRLAAEVPGVLAIDKCRVRRSGLMLFVDIHVVVDAQLTVARGHEIGHDVKDELLRADLSIQDVTVHVEPDVH